ncbi:hypothetical protein [Natronolimnohabitans innermongolicus]|uniref:Uncharacterized protein n=1 Tax=Natronolimnohabitans innermongolicus JCM 12255 TaxID=1227499 RepID=L9XKB5_9EURY|nr:hypothetical protein [Natronolimnohabitans innermongolicus]ELY61068.1 hypothetical protein C493_03080 [Natronolimnohabitans innermongolicus JCM 12255]
MAPKRDSTDSDGREPDEPDVSNESTARPETDVLEALLLDLRSDRSGRRTAALREALSLEGDAERQAVDDADGESGAPPATPLPPERRADLVPAADERESIRSEIDALEAIDDDLRARLEESIEPRLDDVSRAISDVDDRLSERRAETRRLQTDLEALRSSLSHRVDDLEERVASLESRLEDSGDPSSNRDPRTDDLVVDDRVDDLGERLERETVLLRSALSRHVDRLDDDLEAHDRRLAAIEADLEALREWRRSLYSNN